MPNEFDYSDNLARSMRYTQDILKSQLEGMIESLITHEDDDDDRGDAVTRLRRQIAAHLHL